MGHWTFFGVLYWGWVASEVGVLLITRTRKGGGNVRDRGSLMLLWPTILLSVGGATMYGESHAPTMPHMGIAARVLFVAGLAIRWTAIWTLGRAFSANVAIRVRQKLCTRGLFRWVRHPSYTGMMLIFLAIGLATRNWIGLAIIMVPTTAALMYRIDVEEAALGEAFGREYAEYCAVTKRLVPGVY